MSVSARLFTLLILGAMALAPVTAEAAKSKFCINPSFPKTWTGTFATKNLVAPAKARVTVSKRDTSNSNYFAGTVNGWVTETSNQEIKGNWCYENDKGEDRKFNIELYTTKKNEYGQDQLFKFCEVTLKKGQGVVTKVTADKADCKVLDWE